MSEKRIVVLGGSGLLGSALVLELSRRGLEHVVPAEHELDLTRTERMQAALRELMPSAVINAAAFTDVVRAELESDRPLAYRLNRDGPAELARICALTGVPLIHISTDYVFDGRKREPYREDDPVSPLQVYGLSKLEGEREVQRLHGGSLIVRTSTLYGPGRRDRPHYVRAVLRQVRESGRLAVVRLPVSSPTFAPDLAGALLELLERGATGLVHVVNQGECSRLELAREALRWAGFGDAVEVRERPEPAGTLERPAYSALDTSRYREITGCAMRPWSAALREYVETCE